MLRDRSTRLEGIDGGGAPLFPLADLAKWSQAPAEPKRFVLEGFLPERELTLATGAGGANKSTFGQQLATCCAAGEPMLGIKVEPVPAIYITCEDDDDRLHWMATHICRTLQVSLAGLAGRLHLSSLRGRLGNELASFDIDGRLKPTPAFASLRATISATDARLVVLDNAAHFFAGNENDRGQVTAFVNLLYSLCRELDVTILLIAHSNKAGDSYSGSTAWLNAVRSQIVLARPEDSLDPDERLLTLGKANYARQGSELRFRWHEFALVRDEDLPEDRRAELANTAAAANDNAIFIACLDARTKDGLVVSPNVSPNFAPTQFEPMPASKGIGRDRLRKAMERLLAVGEIEIYDHENRGKGRSVKAIRRSSRTTPDVSPDVSRTGSRTVPEPFPDGSRTTPHTPPLYYVEGKGAALEAAAPSFLDLDHPDAPDANPGWSA